MERLPRLKINYLIHNCINQSRSLFKYPSIALERSGRMIRSTDDDEIVKRVIVLVVFSIIDRFRARVDANNQSSRSQLTACNDTIHMNRLAQPEIIGKFEKIPYGIS